jgi:hypothetical protein
MDDESPQGFSKGSCRAVPADRYLGANCASLKGSGGDAASQGFDTVSDLLQGPCH